MAYLGASKRPKTIILLILALFFNFGVDALKQISRNSFTGTRPAVISDISLSRRETDQGGVGDETDYNKMLREVTARLNDEPFSNAWTRKPKNSMSMPIIEKKFKGTGSAVLDRPAPVITQDTVSDQPRRADKYKVLLFNDSGNTREFVARSLVLVVGMPESEAYSIMTNAHKHGMALVGIWHLELAENYCDQLTARGILSEVVPADSAE
mmetsp:Transcript_19967/g.29542  ORF Transcript_19967/g.29542 Transcript_19967/m.29542 type:complete len:210 (+) Transcript_19967:123-752(+)